jgi:hypothetical protein
MAQSTPKARKDERPAANQMPAVNREAERRDALDARDRRPNITAGRALRRVNR